AHHRGGTAGSGARRRAPGEGCQRLVRRRERTDRARDHLHLRQRAVLSAGSGAWTDAAVLLKPHGAVVALVATRLAGCAAVQPGPPVVRAPAPAPTPVAPPSLRLDSVQFGELRAWAQSDLRSAVQAFVRSCAALASKSDDAALGGVNYAGTAGEWRDVCRAAALVPLDEPAAARRFFESEFVPYRVAPGASVGLFTGYYEPQLRGRRAPQGPYQTPLYAVPADLVNVDLGQFRENLKGQRIVGRVMDGRLIPYPARAEIEGRALAAPILFVDDPIDAYFLQVQGSGRV